MEEFTAGNPDGEKHALSPHDGASPLLTRIYRSLIVIALLIVLIFLAGSVWAVFIRKNASSGTGTSASGAASAPGNVFTAMNRLRLTTADSFVVILTVNFPYPPEDRPFSEELAARTNDFRTAAAEYFRRFRAEEILRIDEDTVKAELLEQFNSLLRLGKIEILYFTDYLILD